MSETKSISNGTQRITMMDVAKEAGVSRSTVSFVLNDVRQINLAEATRRRVFEAARALGYRLPRHRTHAQQVKQMIGFIIDEIATSPFGSNSIYGARELAWEHDRTLFVASSGGDAELERTLLQQLMNLRPEGVIYASILTRKLDPPKELDGISTVLLNCYTADRRLPSVVPAEVTGGYTATTRLIAAGHRRVAFINGESWMDASRDRLKGYRRALASADIPFAPELVRDGNWAASRAYQETLNLIALDCPPTAIFCANDSMALGCYEALKDRGKRIPEDVAVMGYDDQWIARHMTPPLTTVLLPHEEMGRWAIEYLIDRLYAPHSGPAPQVKLECPLIERASVQPPKS